VQLIGLYPLADAAFATVVFNLSVTDLNELKSRSICTTVSYCMVFVDTGVVADDFGNPSVGLAQSEALPATSYSADVTRPRFVRFASMNLDSGVMVLVFNEPIDPATVAVSAVSLRNSHDNLADSVPLSTTAVVSGPNTHVSLQLQQQDLDRLKRITATNNVVCRTNTNCFVRFTSSFGRDMSGNPVVAVASDAFRVEDYAQQYVPDTTQPQLVSFDLDLASGLLSLTFSEIVSRQSLQLTQLTLTGSPNATADSSFSITSGVITRSNDSAVLSATLSTADLTGIYAVSQLGTSVNTTFLTFSSLLVADMLGNAVQARVNGVNALQVTTLVTDSGNPVIVALAAFNLRDGFMRLVFSRAVETSTIVYTMVRIQSSATGGIGHQLTGGSATYASVDKKQVDVFFNLRDSRVFQGTAGLTVSANTTFFSAGPSFVKDKYGRGSQEISSFAALGLSSASGFSANSNPAALIDLS